LLVVQRWTGTNTRESHRTIPAQTPPKPIPPTKATKASVSITFGGKSVEMTYFLPKGHKLPNEIFAFDLNSKGLSLSGDKKSNEQNYTIVDRSTMEQPTFFADKSDVEIIPINAIIKVRLSASSNLAEVSVCQDIKLDHLQKLCAKYLLENTEICLNHKMCHFFGRI